jgi:hypothetical protein
MRAARLLRFSVAFFGAGLTVVAVFAYPLGLDNNPRLGSSRAALLALGLLLVWLATGPVLGALVRKVAGASRSRPAERRPPTQDDRNYDEAGQGAAHGRSAEAPIVDGGVPLTASGRRPKPREQPSPDRWTTAFLFGVFAIALVTAWWLGTAGTGSDWPTSTDYYARLAESFHAGRLDLQETPDRRLLELADPYEYEAREGLTYPWDVSYYAGRYYLYWGPAPAVILALLGSLGGDPVTDDQIVFASVIGIVLLSLVLLRLLRRRFAADLPAWTIIPPAVALAFSSPTFFLLDRPRVYEAAIATGQVFFLAGAALLFSLDFEARASRTKLFLAGAFFALAAATRPTLTLGVLVLTSYAVIRLIRRNHRRVEPFPWAETITLLAPLAAAALAMGVYNFARFDNPFEFGHRYQLTGWNLNRQYHTVFTAAHIPLNLFNYLLNDFKSLEVFPFVKPKWGALAVGPISSGPGYYAEQVTGILRAVPFVLLAFLPLALWAQRWLNQDLVPSATRSEPEEAAAHVDRIRLYGLWALTGAALLLPTLLFYFATMRYLADFSYSLLFLACLGFWIALDLTKTRTFGRSALGIVALSAAILSAILGLLLAVTGYTARFEHVNPQLYEAITRLLAW